ncbi:MAG TPA: ABC transporter permease subunit, partial [Sphingobacteriaceae bacterium]|nr:ABC transporter permease subunit [Sphingobacteriaceae bacterium]
NTFVTGIFRAWFALEEPDTAIYLSALLIVIVLVLLMLERWQRKNIRIASLKYSPLSPRRITGKWMQWFILVVLLVPIALGFIIPLAQLIYWAFLTAAQVFNTDFLYISFQSLGIGLVTALITIWFALGLIYFSKWNNLVSVRNVSKIGILGYAMPGAVIAIGVMIPTLALDKWIIGMMEQHFGLNIGFLIHGSMVALVYAYMVRFLAVAYHPIESSGQKISKSIPDSSKMLGIGNIRTLFRIELPLMKSGVLSAFILVFVDVMKELPLTLILKPYQVNTLAVKAYEYASDERVMEAALPSLFIIATAAIPIIFLNRLQVTD